MKNKEKPNQVFLSSNKKYIFDCVECGHELEMILNNVVNGQWCKYCNSNGLCKDDNCEYCFQRSFASKAMASCWSAKNMIRPRDMLKGSDKKCWFKCNKCHHEFDKVLFSIINDSHCTYCVNQKLCEEDCKECFEKSCASHPISQAWSTENILKPREVFKQSNKSIKFNCLTCHHSYQTKVQHYINRDGSCAYCSNQKLCNDEKCSQCFEKSFASHPKIACWSNKNKKQPREMFKGSETKCTFNCDKCHSEFDSKLYNVLTGYWCPYCKNKTEAKVLQFLETDYKVKKQIRFDWCRFSDTNNIMPFDFQVNNVLIEIDGDQHFKQVSNWGDTPKYVQKKDIEKINKSIQNGYSIIHIYQDDIWTDRYDWKAILKNMIESIQSECVFISSTNNYSNHIREMGIISYRYINV